MPLYLTREEAEIWDLIKIGKIKDTAPPRYSQSLEHKSKDERIAEMLKKGHENGEIRQALKTSENRIQRVASQLLLRGEFS